jgi:hypothetical protein
MTKSQKLGGAALIDAILLTLTRNIPIVIGQPADSQELFPQSASGIAQLIDVNLSGWHASHIMALLSFPLFLWGFMTFYRLLVARNRRVIALPFIISMGLGLTLYTVAVVIDGFMTPVAAQNLLSATGEAQETATFLVSYTHNFALSFFAPALFAIVAGIGILSVGLFSTQLYARWFRWAGLILSVIAIVGYISGIFGSHWDNFQVTGPVLMLVYVWFLILGINLMRRIPDNETQSLQPALS